MNTYILKLSTDGHITREPFNADKSLESLQSIVGGYIEAFPLNGFDEFDFYCNEEGKLEGLPFNPIMLGVCDYDIICGNVAVCKHDDEGETLGLTDEECTRFCGRLLSYTGDNSVA